MSGSDANHTRQSMTKIRVVQYGCGSIGCSVVKLAAQQPNIEFVGAIDTADSLNGKDLGKTAGLKEKLDILISADAKDVLCQSKPDLVFLSTVSSARLIRPQVEHCLLVGANVISTCEELCYPYDTMPALAAELDNMAKMHNCTLLATGVNPGFLMDIWPLVMTGVCQQVDQIRVVRIQDASHRRKPFQQKIGVGCTPEEFKERVSLGSIRHVGLAESMAMIASGLGWKLEHISESIEPVIAVTKISTEFITVDPGKVAGVRQITRGSMAGEKLISLEFEAAVGTTQPYDAVYIRGIPDMEVVIKGGTHGDIATAAIIVNSINRVMTASPGLVTMKDLPLVSALRTGNQG
jgi:2,4-diaminopentanoate dehydrogenase